MRNLYVVATGLHQGGGKTVFEAFLAEYAFNEFDRTVFFLDSRLRIPIPPAFVTNYVEPGFVNYWRLERQLGRTVSPSDEVFCINGRPLMSRLNCQVKILLQNRLLLVGSSLTGYGLWPRVRMNIERVWMSTFLKNATEVLVQTPSMGKIVKGRWPDSHVRVLSFHKKPVRDSTITPVRDLIYVGSGEPHKNHRNLFTALSILKEKGITPRVAVTLSPADFEEKIAPFSGLNVENLPGLGWDEIVREYQRSEALIFPSLVESLGLPLVEAHELQLSVLASNRDFVFDVCQPARTFDPTDPTDIARAIQDFLASHVRAIPSKGRAEPGLKHVESLAGP